MNILVTGGSSGLGAEIVKELSQVATNTIYFTYSSSKNNADKLTSTLSNTKSFHCDFRNEESINSFLAEMQNMDIDVLVNNAYVDYDKQYFHKINGDTFLTSFQHNVLPTIKITQQFLLKARKKKSGRIINILSSAIINKSPIGWSEYTANKAYLLSLSKSWATENIKFNIATNSISPSFMLTNFTADTDERMIEQMVENHALKKILTTKEVAETVAFYTKCSLQINGTNLVINAGTDL